MKLATFCKQEPARLHAELLRVPKISLGFLREFEEKPSKDRLKSLEGVSKNVSEEDPFEASMGIYMFKREVLERLLLQNEEHFGDQAGPDTHFGYDVIPHALRDGLRIVAHYHPGYWRVRPGPAFSRA